MCDDTRGSLRVCLDIAVYHAEQSGPTERWYMPYIGIVDLWLSMMLLIAQCNSFLFKQIATNEMHCFVFVFFVNIDYCFLLYQSTSLLCRNMGVPGNLCRWGRVKIDVL